MRRLIRKASKTLYHATTLENLRQIASSGVIVPQAGKGVGMVTTVEYNKEDLSPDFTLTHDNMFDNIDTSDEQNFNGYVFLATNAWSAEEYAIELYQSPENPAIILELSLLESDLLPDDVDDPDAKTWQDSESSIQQVKVGGEVSFSNVQRINFIDKSGETVGTSNPNNFEDDYQKLIEDEVFKSDDGFGSFYDDSYDDEDDDYYGNSQDYSKRKEALENDLSKYKADVVNGMYRVFDTPVEEVAKIFKEHDFLNGIEDPETGEMMDDVDYIEVNVDKSNEVFVTNNLYESFSPCPIAFKSHDAGKSFTTDIVNIAPLFDQNIQKSLNTIIGDNKIDYNGESYTIDELISSLSNKVQSRLKRNFLKKLAAPVAEQYIPGYPNDYEHVNIGIQTVNISDIIGMSYGRHEEYDDNFKPIGEPDERWNRIYEKAKEVGNVDFARPISLVKVPDEEKYFIYEDGNHRLSVAKELGIPTIQAEVIELRKSNGDFDKEYEKMMARINELSKTTQDMSRKQQSLYDDTSLSLDEIDKKYDEIEKEKEPLIEEQDKLWSEIEKLKQNL